MESGYLLRVWADFLRFHRLVPVCLPGAFTGDSRLALERNFHPFDHSLCGGDDAGKYAQRLARGNGDAFGVEAILLELDGSVGRDGEAAEVARDGSWGWGDAVGFGGGDYAGGAGRAFLVDGLGAACSDCVGRVHDGETDIAGGVEGHEALREDEVLPRPGRILDFDGFADDRCVI